MISVAGKPDIVFTKVKIAVFCDGDFWHGHNWAIRGLTSIEEELARYSEYWQKKIIDNIMRDKRNNAILQEEGWTVLRFWESDIKNDVSKCVDMIVSKHYELSL